MADDGDGPTISPVASYDTAEGEQESVAFPGQAPLYGHFRANPKNTAGWTESYEWRFTHMDNQTSPWLIRYEQDTDVTFTKAGQYTIELWAVFTKGDERIEYTKAWWDEHDRLSCTVSESKLEMPNAFSPNGDGINDIYKAKSGYQSLIEFKATIYNRWGQVLYEWTDPADGWDGTYHGKDVAQGVYFVYVKAKGSDGITYNIKRDVNLLRGFTEGSSTADQ